MKKQKRTSLVHEFKGTDGIWHTCILEQEALPYVDFEDFKQWLKKENEKRTIEGTKND